VLAFSPILSPALSATEGNEHQKKNPKPHNPRGGQRQPRQKKQT